MPPPLPIAALLRRSRNAKSARERHDTAYHAWEASLRIAAAGRLAGGTGALPRAAAPSAGDWAEAAALDDARALTAAALLEAHALLREVGRDESGEAPAAGGVRGGVSPPRAGASVTARALLEPLAAYRNRVIGHGAVRDEALLERGARALVEGLAAAWDAGVFAPEGALLVHLEQVEIDARGERRGRLIDLAAAGPSLLDTGEGLSADALPGRVYLATWLSGERRGAPSLAPLHPFIVYEEDDLRERCLFYNGRRRGPELLDLVSGERLRGRALQEMRPGLAEEIDAAIADLERRGGAARAEAPAGDGGGAGGGHRLGDFAIKGRLGAGGMGVVYLARQESLERLVALKTLPPDVARDETARRRFEREVLALSRSDHENVVKILASGRDETSGAPYYAMEYVEGADLAEVARALGSTDDVDVAISSASEKRRAERRELFEGVPEVARPRGAAAPSSGAGRGGPRERLRRLAAIIRDAARGVDHLHRSGILHRDLKPSNIMIAADGRPVVMDLGLAAVAGASRGLTRTGGGLLGTLRYMAPEQARRGLLELDARADVYSLGATLHELATRRPLFDGEDEARLLSQVLHEEPRAADAVDRAVPRDLALVIRKAVEKDRRRRYETAEDLARDLDAFLEGRPVAARPPTLGYLARLAVARHKVLAAAVAGALFVLLDAVAVFVHGLSTATEREAQLRARADASRARSQALIDFMLFDLRDRLQQIGRIELLDTVARRATQYYDGLEARGRLRDADAASRADALENLAQVLEARGRPSEARALLDRSLAIAEARLAAAPSDPARVDDVARAHVRRGNLDGALGRAVSARAEFESALAVAGRALALSPTRTATRVTLAWAGLGLGDALEGQDRHAEAMEVLSRARDGWRALASAATATAGAAAREEERRVVEALGGVADCEEGMGRVHESRGERLPAQARYEAALEARRAIVARAPEAPAHRNALAATLRDVSRARLAAGDGDGGLALANEAVACAADLSGRDPENARFRAALARAKLDLVGAIIDTSGGQSALETCREALALSRDIAARDPRSDEAARDVALALTTLGDILASLERKGDARDAHREALAIAERLAGGAPDDRRFRRDIAVARSRLADYEMDGDRPDEALRLLRPVLEEDRRRLAEDPADGERARSVATSLEKIGRAEEARGNLDAALAAFGEATGLIERLAAADPSRVLLQRDLSTLHEDRASSLLAKEDRAGALAAERRALEADLRLAALTPGDIDQRFVVALRHEQVAAIAEKLGLLGDALASREADAAVLEEIGRALRSSDAADAATRTAFAERRLEMMRCGSDCSRAQLLVALGRGAGACTLARAALERVDAAPPEARTQAPRAFAAAVLAEASVAAGDLAAAASATAIAVRAAEGTASAAHALAARALVFAAKGVHEAALADAALALEGDPDLALPWLVRAQVHAARGARREAEEALRDFARRAPGDVRAEAVRRAIGAAHEHEHEHEHERRRTSVSARLDADSDAGPGAPLPLPVAALLRRARNAKSPKERHDTAYHAWEASVRIAAAARLCAPDAPPSSLGAARLLAPSAGDWVEAAALEDAPSLDAPALLDAHALLREVGRDERGRRSSVTPRSLVEPLAAYRNRALGHGAVRDAAFYDRAAATLARGLVVAWGQGVFAPRGARLAYVESIEVDARGERRARILDLSGAGAALVDPEDVPGLADEVRPRRAYLALEVEGAPRRRLALRPLHPLVAFQDDGVRERVFLYNGARRGPEMLDLVSGERLERASLAAALPGIDGDLARLLAGEGAPSPAGGAAPSDEAARAEERAPSAASPGEDASRVGDFTILGRLGAGGMGVVYLARQESLGRLVALKMLPEDLARDETARRRFEREVAALSRCDHPGVVKILASGFEEPSAGRVGRGFPPPGQETRKAPYYAMEYVEGTDLAEVARELASDGDLERAISTASERRRAERRELFPGVPEVARERTERAPERPHDRFRRLAALFRDAARAVEHLHRSGILHRDLKPANIMVSAQDGRAVIMDLGLATLAAAPGRALTRTGGGLVGTLRYMPPEQVRRGLVELDARADVYSLGASLYELVARRPLFGGETEAQLVEQVLHDEPPPADRVDRAVPRDLALVIRKAVEKDRRRRYETAEDLARDLDAFLEGRPVAARPPTLGYLARLAVARRPALSAALASFAVFLIATVAGYATWLERARASEAELRRDAERDRSDAGELARFVLFDLTESLGRVGRLDLLEDAAREVLAHLESEPPESLSTDERADLGSAQEKVARILLAQGRRREGGDALRAAQANLEAVLAREPSPSARILDALATIHDSRSEEARMDDRADEQYDLLREAIRLEERAFPGARDAAVNAELARLRSKLALLMSGRGEAEAAAREARAAVALLAEAAAADPAAASDRPDADVRRLAGMALVEAGLAEEGLVLCRLAVEGARARDVEHDFSRRNDLANALESLAGALAFSGAAADAIAPAREHCELAAAMAGRRGAALRDRAALSGAQRTLSMLLILAGDLDGAAASAGRSIEAAEACLRAEPGNAGFESDLAASVEARAMALSEKKDPAALEAWRRVVEVETGRIAAGREDGVGRRRLGVARYQVGLLAVAAGRPALALPHLEACIATERAALASAPRDVERLTGLADSLELLGDAHEALGAHDPARAAWAESAALLERALAEGLADEERKATLAELKRRLAGGGEAKPGTPGD